MKPLPHFLIQDRAARVKFIDTAPSGAYVGTTVDGNEVVVVVQKGRAMDVKYLNDKGWYECIEYDRKGNYQCDWVEKKKEETING